MTVAYSVAEDFDKHSKEALADFDNYVGNPIRAFHLMKKLSKEWKNFVNSTLNEEHTSSRLCWLHYVIVLQLRWC